MQKRSAFSVDREGGDQRAMKEAAGVLTKGKTRADDLPRGQRLP
ncbi:MAG: hypothetical protein R3C45_07570 [Phycisphaerales bacterium]